MKSQCGHGPGVDSRYMWTMLQPTVKQDTAFCGPAVFNRLKNVRLQGPETKSVPPNLATQIVVLSASFAATRAIHFDCFETSRFLNPPRWLIFVSHVTGVEKHYCYSYADQWDCPYGAFLEPPPQSSHIPSIELSRSRLSSETFASTLQSAKEVADPDLRNQRPWDCKYFMRRATRS
jgi:hypothetical protein